jgi:hypothetical protein
MPHRASTPKRGAAKSRRKPESRYTVALPSAVAGQVRRCAGTAGTSMSKAIAALVRLGLENQEMRKREFFKRLKANLAVDDPGEQDRMVDEFRSLILGR